MTVTQARFVDIVRDVTGGNAKLPQSEFLTTGTLPVIDQGQSFVAGYTDNEAYLFRSEKLPLVVFGDHTKAVKFVDFPFVMGADGVKVLKPKDGCDAKYLYHFLRHARLPDAGYSRHFKFLKELKVPLPTLPEQRRIVAILDKADAVRAKRREAIAKLDQLLQSVFLDMFGDPATNPRGWPMGSLTDLGHLDRGVSRHRPRGAPELLGGDHPLIQTGDVARSGGYIREFTTTYSDAGLGQSKKWPAGTLCITIAANIAETGILTFDACFPDSVVGFTPNQASNVEFVQELMRFLREILERRAPQVAQKNINLAILRELLIPVPPTDLQQCFARVAKHIERQKRALQSHVGRQDLLFVVLQHRAFSGTL